jgi:hypothetical protein
VPQHDRFVTCFKKPSAIHGRESAGQNPGKPEKFRRNGLVSRD